ncbi:MAG: Gfo/Idh/MocA family oxidoreductase [Chloroflexota bacterium]|nr:Gfo/Idh/MocA family oxidoreductase [Chloroflexota bacterium]
MAIRVGIVGCGFIAQYTYLPVLAEIGAERVEVVAAFDTVQERVDVALETFPQASGYTSYDAFLGHEGGIDLVFNLTPAPLHRDITARALEAGVNVYSEKPIAATLDEAKELTAIAHDKGLALFVAPSTTTTARMLYIKDRIDNGDFGHAHTIKAHIGGMGPAVWRTYSGDPKVFYRKGVGPLVDVGVYMLHTMTGIFGPATRVEAVGGIVYPERTILIERMFGEKITVESPDVLSINLEFAGGRFAHLFTSYAVPASKAPFFELYGTLGSASIAQRQWYDGNGTTDFYFRDETAGGASEGWQEDVETPNPLPIGGILESGILHAVDALENGTPNALTPEHATHVLEIMNGAVSSAETGDPVVLTTMF